VHNLGLDEFFDWFGQERRAGFTKATVAAWRVALEARKLGAVSINVRITAMDRATSNPETARANAWPHTIEPAISSRLREVVFL